MAKNATGLKFLNPTLYIPIVILISILWMAPAVLANPCGDAAKQLRGGLDVTQGRGGIWGYMEKSSSLKEKSMLGFQVDAKLQRLVFGFETMCEEGKIPSQKTFDAISELIDEARNINNQNPRHSPAEKLLEQIIALNKKLDQTLSSLGI